MNSQIVGKFFFCAVLCSDTFNNSFEQYIHIKPPVFVQSDKTKQNTQNCIDTKQNAWYAMVIPKKSKQKTNLVWISFECIVTYLFSNTIISQYKTKHNYKNTQRKEEQMGELYTCKEIADRYGVQLITVWDWIRKKKLGAIKIGKEYRVRDEDIKAFELSRLTIKKGE
nr:MAG TPA: helix-turn-helix domain protein [Caudoviricetes sp.]